MDFKLFLLVIGLVTLGYGLLARKISNAGISAPILATFAGVLLSPLGFDLFDTDIEQDGLILLAELTLVVILFTDASQIHHGQLAKFGSIPMRLLFVGMPLTMLLGALVAIYLLELSWMNALWVAVMLAPTDAALSKSVFSNPAIDSKLRGSIAVESGLNDGLALPVLLFLLALMHAGQYAFMVEASDWGLFIAKQFGFGILIGWATGRWGGQLIQWACDRRWMTATYERLSSVSLALIAYAGAEVLGGNGFLAAFLGGFFLETHRKTVVHHLREFGEAEGEQLSLMVFFLFGIIFVSEAWQLITWQSIAYGLLSLTLIRMLPVLISLTGTQLPMKDKLFLGWYGPRGIASVIYLLFAIEQFGYASSIPAYDIIFSTTVVTILMSIILHGVSPHLGELLASLRHRTLESQHPS